MQWERCIEDGYRNPGKMTTIGNVYRNYCEEAKNAPLLFDPGVFEPLQEWELVEYKENDKPLKISPYAIFR